jgi:aspartate carbamoyltransferase regulatory subunit
MSDKKHIGYIENGINIDHIPHGNAWFVMKILNLFSSESQAGIGLNLPSHKLGVKDLVKIENRVLSQNEIDAISLFCVGSTLSVMKDFVVIQKMTLELPKAVNDIIICPNKRCVSHQHISKFNTFINRKNLIGVKCHYCEKEFMLDEINQYKF